ncbi:MAG: hypothetical protein LBI53_07785 [Candidatus Peribacteria bacterium]|jgi:hypothetical protein|nr:hypothetical protein [Candidatus Peribacteria bacterium]
MEKLLFCMRNLLFYGGILLFLVWIAVRIVAYVQFDRNCEGYLKRAADANNIELASRELAEALKYMQNHDLTFGYTSILYTTPDEDMGFWYKNTESAWQQLLRLDPETISDLEESNILMKLRETLCDNTSSGPSITAPPGISIYPNNALWCILAWLSVICAIGGFIWKVFEDW